MASEKQSVKYFRNFVKEERNYLKSCCEKWIELKNTNKDLNDEILGDINVALGQAELLMREKFAQFLSLIDDCELKRGEKEVTLQDLEGFWDIINIQIFKVKDQFMSLNTLQSNNWASPTDSLVIKRKPLTPRNYQIPKKKKIAQGSSLLRQHILAARQQIQNKVMSPGVDAEQELKKLVMECQGTPAKRVSSESKEFDAGFFRVETPIRVTSVKRRHAVSLGTPKLLSSSALKEHMKRTPLQHKDYSPCIRVTRSMKKKYEYV